MTMHFKRAGELPETQDADAMTEATRFAERSERSPQPRTEAGRKMLDLIYNPDSSYSERMVNRAILDIEAESQQRGSLRSDNGLDVTGEMIDTAYCRALHAGQHLEGRRCGSYHAQAIYDELARLAPQPSIEPERAVPPADPTLCDCGHTAQEHTDRGDQDAGLCLATVADPADSYTGIPCGCPEFVEAEGPPAESRVRATEPERPHPNPEGDWG